MSFRAAIQGPKCRFRGGYLAVLESTFSSPGRESSMAFWERVQGYAQTDEWIVQKSKLRLEGIKSEESEASSGEAQKLVMAMSFEPEVTERTQRLYISRVPKLYAPKHQVYLLLCQNGFVERNGRAAANMKLVKLRDEEIVAYYARAGRGLLDYYKLCDNLEEIKPFVDYHLRFSCLFTLARKHWMHPRQIFRLFSKELLVTLGDREVQQFPSSMEVKNTYKTRTRLGKSPMELGH